MGVAKGKLGFRGDLHVKVVRVHPTFWQRLMDRLRGIA